MLREVELNGTSKIIAIQSINTSFIGIQIGDAFPNPTAEQVNLKVSTKSKIEADIRIVNTMGKILHHEIFKFSSSNNKWSHRVHHFPDGVYHISIRIKNQMHNRLFYKIKS